MVITVIDGWRSNMSLISAIDFVFKRRLLAVKILWCLGSQVKLHLYFSKCGLLSWQDFYPFPIQSTNFIDCYRIL